ncbi:hypothetical protein K466DRAFT_581760 [Polyporus arcularius HHB13444]|uniref:Uncharacterized protein n=1 Tax=Polyporus arcularius HHB13444 TaxID=1314778 RepID=A0A5C3PT01_9APHY|nr:hypothetical protein K466DRAFT_581760 [Polyporus arcularius HHB13444]
MSVLAIAAIALSLAGSVAAQGKTGHSWRIARDFMAGAVVGGVLGLLVSLWMLRVFRRYLARTTVQPTPDVFGAGSGGAVQFGGLGGSGKSANGLGAQEAGFANGTGPQIHGAHIQGGWDNIAALAYQPLPGAPQPDGFMTPPEVQAHTKPYQACHAS